MTVIIDGKKVNVTNGRVKRSIETCADGFTATIPLDETFKEFPFKPFGFEDVEVYLGKELVLTGRLYKPEIDFTTGGYYAKIEGASYAADFVDSVIYPPLEIHYARLDQIAKSLVEQLGLEYEETSEIKPHFFERATADPEDTMFEFVSKLANSLGMLVTSTATGKVTLISANTKSKPVCVLGNDKNPLSEAKAAWDGRDLFNRYRATTQNPATIQSNGKKKGKRGPAHRRKRIKIAYEPKTNYRATTYTDIQVPETRQMSTSCDNATIADVEKTVMALMRNAYADALKIKIPVKDWYIPNTTDLWKENVIVTVQSPAIFLHKGFDMLVRGVEYIYDNNGCTAVLDVIPPQCYSDQLIPRNIFTKEGPSGIDTALAEIGVTGMGGFPEDVIIEKAKVTGGE
jgi:prophage tail gpP-like protein